ncbi:caspase [Drosophila mojavensis]|uniref:Uncharacterized protein n=1 Tax=Drosophila mojavensis TaxID=7230 RepID=B4KLD9_DROMO|nr:caspase [Drosophila mojavensis]EDW12820.1 uncharacterized protein Dmoj_GI22869 [Drosophila mojavensis]
MCDQNKSNSGAKEEQITSDTSNASNEFLDGACLSVKPTKHHSTSSNVAVMVTHRYAFEYKMSHPHRGLAMIFSHEHFNKKGLPSRPETVIDSENLSRVLKKLGFDVRIYKDLCHETLRETLNNAVGMDHSNNDCILIALLTHGKNNKVYAHDHSYELERIWESFTADKCPTLAGKPKIIIVQACRGNLRDPGYFVHSKGHTETDGDSECSYRIPRFADFLVAFCTVPNYRSWSNTLKGSWFIYNLCEELEANAHSMNMLSLLTFVSQRVANCESDETQEKQISCCMSTLTRVLNF